METCSSTEVGDAFKSVSYDHDLFKQIIQRFALFVFEDGFIEYAKIYLHSFDMSHIRLLHKNYCQTEEIKKHVWIESEKNGRDMKKEATIEWIDKHREEFNNHYDTHYWPKFIEADLSDVAHLIKRF